MKQKFITIILSLVLNVLSFSCLPDLQLKSMNTEEKHKIENIALFRDLLDKYPWMTSEIFKLIQDNLQVYNLSFSEIQYLTKVLSALIQHESRGKQWATGIPCQVWLFKENGYVKETHRARGLMQVMIYSTTLTDSKQLYNLKYNIHWGVKIFMRGYKPDNIEVSLKNYNSGINSDYYNWKYIDKITNELEI